MKLKHKGSLGFVPTMGALHDGHLSLIRKSKKQCRFTAVSILVNPLQFGPHEDFSLYPRPRQRDLAYCRTLGVDMVLAPSRDNFYTPPFSMELAETDLSTLFCGHFRPGHFDGVVTVVAKLLNLAGPDRLYLGRKDYQQCRVIERFIKNLSFPVTLVTCPTSREKDGLALSSRNAFLNPRQRKAASGIYGTLKEVQSPLRSLPKPEILRRKASLQKQMQKKLQNIQGFRLQYAALVDGQTLKPLHQTSRKAVLLAAGFFGSTRLIDNISWNLK